MLVEHGRRIGGRGTTRKSRKHKYIEFDHGLPSISFSQHVSKDILTLVAPLINSQKLVDISKDILLINEAIKKYPDIIKEYFSKIYNHKKDFFCLENLKFINNGIFIFVKDNSNVKLPIEIDLSDLNDSYIFPRIFI